MRDERLAIGGESDQQSPPNEVAAEETKEIGKGGKWETEQCWSNQRRDFLNVLFPFFHFSTFPYTFFIQLTYCVLATIAYRFLTPIAVPDSQMSPGRSLFFLGSPRKCAASKPAVGGVLWPHCHEEAVDETDLAGRAARQTVPIDRWSSLHGSSHSFRGVFYSRPPSRPSWKKTGR